MVTQQCNFEYQLFDYYQRLGPIIAGMDHYSLERWVGERHQAMIRTAETRSRLLGSEPAAPSLGTWLAARLHHLADRLEGKPRFETVW
jgi:hypothetical protein